MTVKCRYVGNDSAGLESEVEDGGVISCKADADVVIRLKGVATMARLRADDPARKTPVCWDHAQWLCSDETEVDWEQCGEDVSPFASKSGVSDE